MRQEGSGRQRPPCRPEALPSVRGVSKVMALMVWELRSQWMVKSSRPERGPASARQKPVRPLARALPTHEAPFTAENLPLSPWSLAFSDPYRLYISKVQDRYTVLPRQGLRELLHLVNKALQKHGHNSLLLPTSAQLPTAIIVPRCLPSSSPNLLWLRHLLLSGVK